MDIKFYIACILPELLLSATAAVILIYELTELKSERVEIAPLAIVGLICVLFTIIYQAPMGEARAFWDSIVIDDYSRYFKILFTVIGILVILTSHAFDKKENRFRGEYYLMILSSMLGMFTLVSSTDIIMIYLSIELISLPSYVLAGYDKQSREGSEGALKYLLYGALSSGLMLFGLSYIYGIGGSTNLLEIRANFDVLAPSGIILLVSFILVFAGFGYKIAAAPFHMWSPDVYQAAPTPITMFFSAAPKAAGFAALTRICYLVFTAPTSPEGGIAAAAIRGADWPTLIMVVSALTMTIGNLSALWQNNVKRLLAFSSIAHAGYMLMGLSVVSELGVKSIMFYLGVYALMNIGAFAGVAALETGAGIKTVDEYKGAIGRAPWLVIGFTICLFSLVGLPPLAGFIGKFYLFAAVVKKGVYWLALVGVINSVIGLYYYVRVVRAMVLDKGENITKMEVPVAYYVVMACTVAPVMVLGIYWSPLIDWIDASLKLAGM